ncbi:MAG: OsmC family protein [Dehalococcoidia bacterium]|nr:OsmC family protein [Dehalococcoidia bacterium]
MTTVIAQSLPDYDFAQLMTAPGVSLVADEPEDLGGDDLGPSPYELLTWALGACTAMTIQMYARRKEYPLEEVAVQVEHERVHARDCHDCENEHEGYVQHFHRRIVLRGDLTEEQQQDLMRVAGKCPVHKTLMAVPEVHDSLEVVA